MSKLLQISVLICGLRTELIVQPFADRVLVLVTQVGKIGYLIQASIPSTIDLRAHTSFDVSDLRVSLPSPSPAIQLTTIFGSVPSAHLQTLYSLYATHIATLVWLAIGGEPRSIIVGIALQMSDENKEGKLKEEQQTFNGVISALWNMLM